MLILVDTNVLLRVIEPKHSQHQDALTAIRMLRQAEHELCVCPQIHYEFWVAATRSAAQNGLGLAPGDATALLQRFGPPWIRLLRDERTIYEHWRELVATYHVQGKQAHDARLVAAMLRHGVRCLLTFNQADFQRYSSIQLIDPRRAESTQL
jgi:predicted nucleic acid-binding protein